MLVLSTKRKTWLILPKRLVYNRNSTFSVVFYFVIKQQPVTKVMGKLLFGQVFFLAPPPRNNFEKKMSKICVKSYYGFTTLYRGRREFLNTFLRIPLIRFADCSRGSFSSILNNIVLLFSVLKTVF